MAHSKSAKKRLQQNLKRNLHNRSIKAGLKTQRKKFLAALATGDREAATTQFREAVKLHKKAAAKGVIHANAASRTESRLAQKLNTLQAPAVAP